MFGDEKKFEEITRKEWATIDWVEITRISDTDRRYIATLPIHDPETIIKRYNTWEEARKIVEGD